MVVVVVVMMETRIVSGDFPGEMALREIPSATTGGESRGWCNTWWRFKESRL